MATTTASRASARGALSERSALLAETLYAGGYHCGESVVKAINEVAGHPLPPSVMRMASGFCAGIGGTRRSCGALAGAVMAVGLLAGREHAGDEWAPAHDASAEIHLRFSADQGCTDCADVVSAFAGMDDPERVAHCTLLTGRCAAWVASIAEERGWL